ncbi:hypothetical protein PENTCL1PPCAC_29095, partial [Pristionchus entomophagus]
PYFTQVPSSSSAETSPINGSVSVFIRNFEKRGEGANTHIVYVMVTEVRGATGYSYYEVRRRFSDFIGLHGKLVERTSGVGIPEPPGKSIQMALTKTKLADAEKYVAATRMRLLERYMFRVIALAVLRSDADVINFLTMEGELPRATNTSAVSSSGVKKIFKSVEE